VTDVGIALVIGKQRMTTTGVSIGTPYYMSPEQIVRPQALDHRTDVYSMGIVLYELLTGRVPFDSDSDFEVRSSHVHATPPQPGKLNPAIPETLEKVVLKALAKDPNSRYAGCAEFARAIHAYLNNELVTDAVKGRNFQEPVWKDAATVTIPYRQPVKQTKPSKNPVAPILVIIHLGLIAAAVVATFILVESIMISFVVLTIMGAVVAWFSRRHGWTGIVFGLSAFAVSVLCGLLIIGNHWRPSKAQEPISVIMLIWGIAVFPLGIATYLKLKESHR
jgi:serine/threonine protein kinase